jgi:hypothetical protein
LRTGKVLSRGPGKIEFLKDRQWRVRDFIERFSVRAIITG